MQSVIDGIIIFATLAGTVCILATVVCSLVVIIRMAAEGNLGMAGLCLVMIACGGLGLAMAFILGWGDRKLTTMMRCWAGLLVVSLVSFLAALALS